MPTVKGRAEVKRFIASIPGQMEEKVLRGAARAGIDVISEDASNRVTSDTVRNAFKKKVRRDGGVVVATLSIKAGWARDRANWLEYGTDPHFITVDDSQRQGMVANRINKLGKTGTLVIKGEPVGKTVFHPGADRRPFLRPALDAKEAEAIAAAQAYINARVTPNGIVGTDQGDDE